MIRAAALLKTPFVCVQQFNKINSHGFFDTKETERVTTVTMTMTTGLKQHIKEIKVQAKRILKQKIQKPEKDSGNWVYNQILGTE